MVDTTQQESRATGGSSGAAHARAAKVVGAGYRGPRAAAGGGVPGATRAGHRRRRLEPGAGLDAQGPRAPPRTSTPSGSASQTHDVSVAEDFGDWLGRPLDCVVVFGSDANWAAISGPWFAIGPARGPGLGRVGPRDPDRRTLVVSTALVPKDPPDDWRARGAAGEYDAHWMTYGRNLVEQGLGASIIRLGWELNGDWYETHYVGESAEQREQWKDVLPPHRPLDGRRGSAFEIDFNIAEGPQDSVSIEDLYPGDDYVDIIGVDVYQTPQHLPDRPRGRALAGQGREGQQRLGRHRLRRGPRQAGQLPRVGHGRRGARRRAAGTAPSS